MTTTDTDRPVSRRPGAGVPVDPVKLMALRYRRNLTRLQLSAAIAGLGLAYENGAPVRAGRDHLGKIERGQNRASQEVLGAICTVLECKPEDLLPGGDSPEIPDELVSRLERPDYDRDLQEFAREFGLAGKRSWAYHDLKLREAFGAHEALEAAVWSGDRRRIRAATAKFEAALKAARRLLGTGTAA